MSVRTILSLALLAAGSARATAINATVIFTGGSDYGTLSGTVSFTTGPDGSAPGTANVIAASIVFTGASINPLGNPGPVPGFSLDLPDLQAFSYTPGPANECGPPCPGNYNLALTFSNNNSPGISNGVNMIATYTGFATATEIEGLFSFSDTALGPGPDQRGQIQTTSFNATPVVAVPEPQTASLLLGAMALGLFGKLRRRNRSIHSCLSTAIGSPRAARRAGK